LDYADQRFYASTYGRFGTPDPSWASVAAGSPGSWNRYSYASSDPVNRNDPSGLDDWCDYDPDIPCDYFDPSSGSGSASSLPSCNGSGGNCNCIGAVVLDPACISTYGVGQAINWLAAGSAGPGLSSSPVTTVFGELCGTSSTDLVMTSITAAVLKGIIQGATAGAAGGEMVGGIGGVPGAILGAFVVAVINAGGAAISSGALASACSAAGVYSSNPIKSPEPLPDPPGHLPSLPKPAPTRGPSLPPPTVGTPKPTSPIRTPVTAPIVGGPFKPPIVVGRQIQ
jgi:hypothetical protein